MMNKGRTEGGKKKGSLKRMRRWKEEVGKKENVESRRRRIKEESEGGKSKDKVEKRCS